MCVVLGGQPEVAERRGVITRLLHRPKHQRGDRTFLRRAAHAIDELLKVLRAERMSLSRETVAERRNELLEVRYLLDVRRLMNAVERGHSVRGQVRRHRFVGQQHELFDQTMGDVTLGRKDRLNLSMVGEDDVRLRQIEVNCAPPPATAVEHLEQLVHQFEQRHEPGVPSHGVGVSIGKNRVYLRVGHTRVAVDDTVMHLVPHDVAPAIDFHHTRLHEPIDPRIQAAETSGQFRGEHVDGSLRKVDRRRAFVGLFVECAPLLHVVRDVRDVDPERIVPVRQPIDGDGVVEVPGMFAIDRDCGHESKIGAAADVLVLDYRADASCLDDRSLGVNVGNVMLANDDLGVDAGLFYPTQHFDHVTNRPARRGRPPCDLDDDHLARLGGTRLARRHVDVREDTAIEWHDVSQFRGVQLESPDHARLAALEDSYDPPLGTSLGLPFDTGDDTISVHRLHQIAGRHIDIPAALQRAAGLGVIRHDEPESAGVGL